MQNQCVHFLISKLLAFLTTCYISLLPRLPPHWNTNIESVKAVPVAWSQAFVTVHFFYHLHAKTGGGNSLGMRLPNSYLVFQKAHHNMNIAIFPLTLLAGVILPLNTGCCKSWTLDWTHGLDFHIANLLV